MEAFTEVTKLVEATHFLFHFRVNQHQVYLFKTHFGSSWVKAMDNFFEVYKLVEATHCLFHFISYVGKS